MKAKKWVLVKHFDGVPKEENLEIQEEELPELQDGDILLEAQCWSVDPYMRGRSNALSLGDTMVGQHLARVIESKNENYPVGKLILASLGWRTHTVCNPDKMSPSTPYSGIVVPAVTTPANIGTQPQTTTLGVLGMPGATAYFGLLEICKPQPGETVLVNGAAGAVGSIVGQIAKIKGCNVIGFAGSDDKVKFIKEELGFDHAFNYKTDDIDKSIRQAAPNGIDCYFDNVGGIFSTKVIFGHMNTFGRMSICGVISRYNDDSSTQLQTLSPEIYGLVLTKQLLIQGFIVLRWFNKYNEAWSDLLKWIKEGKLKYREHKTEGFDNMRSAFYGMLKGENTGKAVITADSTTL